MSAVHLDSTLIDATRERLAALAWSAVTIFA
jgi:hypothetical protein